LKENKNRDKIEKNDAKKGKKKRKLNDTKNENKDEK